MLNLFYDRINWKPNLYIATDDLLIKDIYSEINTDIIPEIKACFFPDIHPSNVEIKNNLIKSQNNVFWLNTDRPGFTLDLPYCGINKTVINPGLQILSYLGLILRQILIIPSLKILRKNLRVILLILWI